MAFIAMLFAGFAVFLFVSGIVEIIVSIILKIVNAKRVRKGREKSRVLSVISIICLIFGILSTVPLDFIVGFSTISNISQAIQQRNSLEYHVYADNIDRARTLLEEGADPNAYEQYLYPPLYFALENDDYNMAVMLFKYGANPDATGAWDTQMFHEAVKKSDLEYVKLFTENGADINYVVSSMTPLDLARYYDNDEIVEYLLANGAKSIEEIEE